MDPVSLLLFLGIGFGAQAAFGSPKEPRYFIREIGTVDGQWKFSELLSEGAIEEVERVLDLEGFTPWPMISSGQYRLFLMADLAGDGHVLFRMIRGGTGWSIDQIYAKSGCRASDAATSRIRYCLDYISGMVDPSSSAPQGMAPVDESGSPAAASAYGPMLKQVRVGEQLYEAFLITDDAILSGMDVVMGAPVSDIVEGLSRGAPAPARVVTLIPYGESEPELVAIYSHDGQLLQVIAEGNRQADAATRQAVLTADLAPPPALPGGSPSYGASWSY